MSAYVNFRKNFIERTKENLDWAAENKVPFEATNLLNSCLGLIVLPTQFLHEKGNEQALLRLPNDLFQQMDIEKIPDNNKSADNIIRHLRNGIAHGRIEQLVKDGDIVGIQIEDRTDNDAPASTIIRIDIDNLKDIALTIANACCEAFHDVDE